MALLTAAILGGALLALGMALVAPRVPGGIQQVFGRWQAHEEAALRHARVSMKPQRYALLRAAAPILGVLAGWALSPPCALIGLLAGAFGPRLYLGWLVHQQAQQADAETPRLVQALLAQLAAGATYFDAIRHARLAVADPWVRGDLDAVVHEFMLDVPLATGLRRRRGHIRSHNLGLVWDTLAICIGTGVPTSTAKSVLAELSSTVHFNVQLQHEVQARSAGQRLQVWLLAILVPGLYLYLRVINPDLLAVLDDTALGHYLLLPLALFLEVLGLYLSARMIRVRR
jgi:Flp pilus assembly protein TadB